MIEQTLRTNTGKQLSETVHCLPHIRFLSLLFGFVLQFFRGGPRWQHCTLWELGFSIIVWNLSLKIHTCYLCNLDQVFNTIWIMKYNSMQYIAYLYMFIRALFTIAQRRKPPTCSKNNEGTDKSCYVQTIEC